MKNVFTILSLVLTLSISANANNTNPSSDDEKIVLDNSEMALTLHSFSSLVVATDYVEGEDFFTIETKETINFLQVVNENGELEYQLPIGAKVLKLALPDFAKGTFHINLLVEGEDKFITTELVKKI